MKRIFADLHHDSLFKSLQFLFEKRLGWELYRPVGEEWFRQGYWMVAAPYGHDIRTVVQYLGLRFQKQDKNGVYYINGAKAITLDKFKEMDIDIVIASIPQHLEPYTRLIKQFKPNAKLIYQMGNHFGPIDFSLAKNIMSSTSPFKVPSDVNAVFYHQEFDLDVFKYEPPTESNKIYSFVHCLREKPEDYQTYLKYKEAMPEFEFKSFGSSCDDGCVQGEKNVADKMREAGFGFHCKEFGDGFGHVVHGWFARGRPPIVKHNQYQGKLAGELMIDRKTCIDLDKRNFDNNVKMIREMAIPENHIAMCQNASKRFKEIVDFDAEFIKLKKFLERLI